MIEVDPQRVIQRLIQRISELEMEVAKYAAAVDQMEAAAVERQQQSGDDLEGSKSAAEQETG
jgi:uncharacterized coiled-coil protein SlyX